ncbi:molecular chaperone DnaK [Variovorax paradoxus]|jgi:DnaK suppressor protein|uniref:TraR/DksA family transcriptional regulator n=1 Tax=Variovorax paradoxus TaxID=34073 RepID=UPI0006E6F429|nr:molecular chaperone DnaK [Variovorax paradoxus]KPV10367.1 molecular chaperone DnaK [Variovorax paradoxus]KPV12843.1 molecular chaperone DnaK [Variovorax paradoxus]KPV24069.1 molecular chaperone DnaK [Variovorax paradoxus]KPV35185.1 molecular chaperone DnaK [Variovorax paradoxus]
MRHLDTTDRRALRLQLDTMRRQVLDELRASAPSAEAALAENDHEVKTHADEVEAERAGDVHMAEVEIDRARLEEIEQAIARLASGRYGICEDCANEIPRARLLARPTAIRCTACQTATEARRRH